MTPVAPLLTDRLGLGAALLAVAGLGVAATAGAEPAVHVGLAALIALGTALVRSLDANTKAQQSVAEGLSEVASAMDQPRRRKRRKPPNPV